MVFTKKQRDQIYERDGGRCVACGTTYGLEINHRANRGMGGSRYGDTLENGVLMCHHHNVSLEASAEFAERGRVYGWKVHRNRVTPPADVPVWYVYERTWFYLEADGTRLAPNQQQQEVLSRAAKNQLTTAA